MSTDALADSAYAASATLTRLKADLERSQANAAALRAELADVRASRASSSESAERLHADLRDRESDLLKLRELLEQRDSELATSTATARKKDERIAQLRSDAKQQASEAFDAAEANRAKLCAEEQRGAAERDALKKELQAARSESARLQNEQNALAGGEMVVVQSMAAELQAAHAAREQAEAALVKAQDELVAAKNSREENMARWGRERQELQQQLAEQSSAPPPPSQNTTEANPGKQSGDSEWMAEKILLSERLAKAEKRAIDTMTRFLALQTEKNKLAGECNALRAELESQKQIVQEHKPTPESDGDINKIAKSATNAFDSASQQFVATADTDNALDDAAMLSPTHGPEEAMLSPTHGPEAEDDDDGEVLAQEDVEEYAQDILGMELPRLAPRHRYRSTLEFFPFSECCVRVL